VEILVNLKFDCNKTDCEIGLAKEQNISNIAIIGLWLCGIRKMKNIDKKSIPFI
jgi:hypothetical protein